MARLLARQAWAVPQRKWLARIARTGRTLLQDLEDAVWSAAA